LDSIKIAFVGLAVCFVAFVSIIAYQTFSETQEHSHDEDYSTNLYNFMSPTELQGKTRTYYIAADEVKWNYAPTGKNQITGMLLADDEKASVYTISGKDRIGSTYLKCLYRGYTDSTFITRESEDENWKHLGILGPVIHAEVGDTIKVVFKNNCRIPTSIHPHGVFYDKASEGAPYNDGVPVSDKPGAEIETGKTFTYEWKVPLRAGPGPHDPSSIVWMYHSHVDEVSDTYAGLIGPMIITKKGEANPDGTPKGVDKEFVTMFSVMNENNSPYLDYNVQTFTQDPSSVNANDEDFEESNLMHSINGYVFGNLPGLVMKENTHVRWYVAGVGTEVDLHTPHWHGETLLMNGMRTDMVELLPMSMKVLDMYPDNSGTWLYHCHVNDHILAGMQALFTVTK
jgi:FtsP/CotA-like multicopper oxidase with cupredoxin domain